MYVKQLAYFKYFRDDGKIFADNCICLNIQMHAQNLSHGHLLIVKYHLND